MRQLLDLQFGPYAPDQPDLGNTGLEMARNVLPRLRGYDSLPALNQYGTNTLGKRCVGAFSAKDANENSYIFAGTADALFSLSGNLWSDVSRTSPAYSPVTRWDFTRFNQYAIAAHLDDKPQAIDLGAANFSDLTASNVQGAAIATVRNFVVLGNVKDDDGHTPWRVRWSPISDPTGDWTPDPATLADFQNLPSVGGKVQRVIGGEFGMVFRELSVHRMTFVGSPAVWQFDEVDPSIGTISPGSVVRHGARIFFFSEDGVRMTAGDASQAVGEERIDLSLLSDLDAVYVDRVTGAVYTDEQIIVWAYPGSGNIGGTPNRLLIYNYGTDKWATGDEAVDILFQAATPFRSIDGFDDDLTFGGTQSPALYASVDDIPGSLDDHIWSGGSFELGAIDATQDLAFYTGPARAAEFESGEYQLTPGRRTFISEMRSLVNAPDVGCPEGLGVQVGHRSCQSLPVQWGPVRRGAYGGFIPERIEDRFLRFRIIAESGFRDAVGLQVFGEPSGGR